MQISHSSIKSRRSQRCFAAAAVTTVMAPLLASCASPGIPRPPSLHLASVVTDLSAQRIGNLVHLHWTTPSRTTDGLNLTLPITAEVCREAHPTLSTGKPSDPAPQTVSGCDTVLHLTVKPGPTEADDRLPPDLLHDPAALIGYRIRLLNPKGRSAGFSPTALVPSGNPPLPVASLKATATREGALVEWQPSGSQTVVELDRTLVSTPNKPAKKSAVALPEEQPAQVKLRTGHDDTPQQDPGGTLDRTALRGQQYIYRAQRIDTIALDGKRYELRGELSAPITLTMKDSFPPSPPHGLAAIPGSPSGSPTIDLSWEPNTETDIAGYNVYRRYGTTGIFQRLTTKPVLGPAFSDTAANLEGTYTYRVTAVDGSGNESSPSGEVTEPVSKH
ncbi:MAG TPA: fibronectin type III domain-containing protein [Edaphobacter sp.]|nr:fibronectin type III domain-containing protein [Edaphobacter sp.]